MAKNKISKSKLKKITKNKLFLQIFCVFVVVIVLISFCALVVYKFDVNLLISDITAFFDNKDDSNNNNNSNVVLTNAESGKTTVVSTLKPLKVTFVDVGQGDCIIIEFPDGKNMIVDAGDNAVSTENSILSYTSANNITTFDYLLLTHQDSDHVGSMNDIFEHFEVKYVFKPNVISTYNKNGKNAADLPNTLNTGFKDSEGGCESQTAAYYNFLTSLQAENCGFENFNKDSDFYNSIKYNDNTYTYTVNFLTPVAERNLVKYGEPYNNEGYSVSNDYSPIITITYAEKVIMLTGDAEAGMEHEYNTNYSNTIDIDILKVSHHGSQYCTNDEFLNNVNPEYAVIMTNGVKYGHPTQITLDRLHSHNSSLELYRTDKDGNIYLSITENGTISFSKSNTENDISSNFIHSNGNFESVEPILIKITCVECSINTFKKQYLVA